MNGFSPHTLELSDVAVVFMQPHGVVSVVTSAMARTSSVTAQDADASRLFHRRINLRDDDELAFWMREFGVGPGELFEAIQAVGSSARFVEQYLLDPMSRGYDWPDPEIEPHRFS